MGTRAGADPRVVRQAMRHVPTAVTVVCARDGRARVGHTIGSFVSASLDPPLVGYFAMRSSVTLGVVRRTGRFSVNVLGEHQVELARLFAERCGEHVAGVAWQRGTRGRPHLVGAVAVLDCDVDQVMAVGDHELVVGRVVDVTVPTRGPDPLLFAGGRFRALAPGTPGQATSTSMSTGTPLVMTS